MIYMKFNRKFNLILVCIAICCGLYLGIDKMISGDIYSALIRFAIVPVMLVPLILRKVFHREIGAKLETIYLLFVFCAHFLGSIIDLYHSVPGYDKVMHLLSGSVSALVALYVLIKLNQYSEKSLFFNVLFIIAFTIMIAGFWEYYEYTCDQLFQKDAQNVLTTGVGDTMQDMIAATIGSILVIIMYLYEVLSHSNWFITRFMKETSES